MKQKGSRSEMVLAYIYISFGLVLPSKEEELCILVFTSLGMLASFRRIILMTHRGIQIEMKVVRHLFHLADTFCKVCNSDLIILYQLDKIMFGLLL